MTCQEFTRIINDLAHARMMDASLREAGIAHVASCTRCALWLADEQSLSEGLRAMAVTTESTQAPARVETALLAAFRQQQKSANSQQPTANSPEQSAANVANTGVVISLAAFRAPHLKWWLAAAAAIALLALAAPGLMNSSDLKKENQVVRETPTPLPLNESEQPRSEPQQQLVNDETPQNEERLPQMRRSNGPTLVGNRPAGRDRPRVAPSHLQAVDYSDRAAPMIEAVPGDRVFSDFIPLNGGWTPGPLDGGYVMRVKMPRSALPALGLPVNADRFNESIEAEVLVGDDNLPQAIRFANNVPRRRTR